MEASWVITCEHASAALPAEVGTLGVHESVMASHVAWDPGAAEVARRLAQVRGVTAELGEYTRLLVDLNRGPDNPCVVPEVAFGVEVPGNRGLTQQARRERIARWHAPYWERVRARVREALGAGRCMHVSAHSFTPELDPERRTFPIGLLFDPEREHEVRAVEGMAALLRNANYRVEYNEPYPGTMDLITTRLRSEFGERYVGIEIEINQAMMTEEWAERLVAVLEGTGGGRYAERDGGSQGDW